MVMQKNSKGSRIKYVSGANAEKIILLGLIGLG